jgi:hypothetical protein
MKRWNVLIWFMLAALLIRCSKEAKQETKPVSDLQHFVSSPVYRDFVKRNRPAGKIDMDAARIVRVSSSSAIVHIPVMERNNIAGSIIGLPAGGEGGYELLYQDNRAALSGTGNINLYTSTNQLFGRIDLQNGKIRSFDTENLPGQQSGDGSRVDCGFLCQLNQCYHYVKAQFPSDPICKLLDVFYGVCTSATLTTCLIKMAAN